MQVALVRNNTAMKSCCGVSEESISISKDADGNKLEKDIILQEEQSYLSISPPLALCENPATTNHASQRAQTISTTPRGCLFMTINLYYTLLSLFRNKTENLWSLILNLPQPSNSTPNSHGTCRTQTIRTTGNSLFTTLARPNSHNGTLDGVLAAEGTTVCGVLGHFHLAEEFTEGGTVACSVFAGDSNLSCALSHGLMCLEYRKML